MSTLLRTAGRTLEGFWRDVRYAAFGLRRAPGFTLAVMLMLGLGIGANTAMLGAIDRLMFRAFPYLRDPGSVHRVYFQSLNRGRLTGHSAGPYARYLDIQRDTRSFSDFAAFTEWTLALGDGPAAREHQVAGVSASLFRFFDARPIDGRFFTAAEDRPPRGADVAVLGYDYWRTALGGRDVIGTRVRVGPLLTTIIGVAPPGFVGVSEGEAPAVFLPITTLAYGVNEGDAASFATAYNWDWMRVMVRRKPGVRVAAANADLTHAYLESWAQERVQLPFMPPARITQPRAVIGPVRTLAGPEGGLESRTLLWVTGVAVIVLLIACANIANLLLVRVLRRRREIAVRMAMGMSAGGLVRQFAAEGLLLAALGAAAGVVVARFVAVGLSRLAAGAGAATPAGIAMDARSLAIAAALALSTGVAIYVVPSVLAARAGILDGLRAGARATAAHHERLQSSLLVLQGALSVALLVGAGLFVRSLLEARAVDLGWTPDHVLVVTPNYRGYAMDSAARDAFRRQLLDDARAIPGVTGAARVDNLPFATNTARLRVDGIDSVARIGRFVSQVVSPEYFSVVGTRILRGRGFDAHDRAGAPPVGVVSQSAGRALWPGRDPIGQCMYIDSDACTRVVGIAEDAAEMSIADDDRYSFYQPDDQPPRHPANRLFLRVAGDDPQAYSERVRRTLSRAMPGDGYVTVSPLESIVDAQRRSWSLGAAMFAAFGGLALLVAAVGLYGVISYQVAQRRHELAIRIAVGAQASDVVGLVFRRTLALAAAGIAVGLLAALGASRWVSPLLFRESARDPSVYGGVAAVILLVAIAAGAAPAVRALRTDPNVVLRDQ